MNRIFEYKGFTCSANYDYKTGLYVANLKGTNDRLTFKCENLKVFKETFHKAIDEYLITCERANKNLEESFNGELRLKLPKKLHIEIYKYLLNSGMTMSQLVNRALIKEVTNIE